MAPVAFADEQTALKQALHTYRQGTYDVVRLIKTERDSETGRERHTTIFDTTAKVPDEPAAKSSMLLVVIVAGVAIMLGVAVAVGLTFVHR
ncbi:MAG TPA: hypothetical protein VNT30_13745 [Stellaceae bacterium]|nr:hypothetical protein [Stellaceae bacterium]